MSDIDSADFDDELLSAYLDNELAPEERARVEERLAAEPRARQLLDELRAVSRTLKELPAATLGTDLRETVLRRAERAMLVPGESAAADGLGDIARRIPFGRSKRAWFWAGGALAAGLLLMVFQREPGRNEELPGEVALRDSDLHARKEAVPPLEMRSADEAAGVAAVPRVRRRENARGGGGVGGVEMGAPMVVDARGDELLVVHVNVKPGAIEKGVFDALLVANQIEVEELASDESKNERSPDLDVVLVEASLAQILGCVKELNRDHSNYLGVEVDARFPSDQLPSGQRTVAKQRFTDDLKRQYDRGAMAPQSGSGATAENQRPTALAYGNFSSGTQQNVARRAKQKLATKAEMMQVLFVLRASEEPAEEGLPIDD